MGGTAPRKSLSQVFVEVPPSRTPLKHPHVPSAGHKENALSRPSASQMSSSTHPAPGHSKRKLDVDTPAADEPAIKKHKQPKDSVPTQSVANTNDEFPNGFVYCHQCNKKRDATLCLRCTTKDRKGRRCHAKYCKPCLKNRYGLLLEDIVADGETDQDNHVHGEGYHFRCPRCDDVCNCVACRKAKGLQPTGNLTNAARQSGLTSAAEVLRQDPKAAGPMAHKPVEQKTKPQHSAHGSGSEHAGNNKFASAPDVKEPARSSKLETQTKSALQAKVKAFKSLPKPVWTSVDTALSQDDAEERINIREFALRFSATLGLSRSHLDELDEIRPTRTRNADDEDDELVPWISEACLKSLLLGLLNMVDAKGDREKHVKATVKSVRESGAHLGKMWAALATLRDWQESAPNSSRATSTSLPLSYPDPLPPPEPAFIIQTRSGKNQSNKGSVNIIRTAQLVPVISALVDAAVESEAARQELEVGIQESKERTKEAREAQRVENERFEKEKEREKMTGKRLDKSRTEYHKRTMATIDSALRVASYAYIPRISPLGRDIEGRVYWALTPGTNEREDALDLLQSNSQGRAHKSKSRRKRLVPSEEDRNALRKWSWFIAVWGNRPPITERTPSDSDEEDDDDDDDDDDGDDDDDDDDDDDEQWWGFSEPDEIMKLASWVHCKADLEENLASALPLLTDTDVDMEGRTSDEDTDDDSGDTPTKNEVATLVRELQQYASLLRGRIQKDE